MSTRVSVYGQTTRHKRGRGVPRGHTEAFYWEVGAEILVCFQSLSTRHKTVNELQPQFQAPVFVLR